MKTLKYRGNSKNPKVLENPVEKLILDYLDCIPNSVVMKMNRGGRPVKNKQGQILLIPFKSRFSQWRISDIYFLYKGKTFWFETKNPEEHKYIKKHLETIRGEYPPEMNKKRLHIYEQDAFHNYIKRGGGFGGFVSSINCVKEILSQHL